MSEVSINRSLDSLDPAGLLTSPKFRSRNESYMRAMSTISQVRAIRVSVGMHHYRGGQRGRGHGAGEEGRHTGTIDRVDRKRSQTLRCRPHVHPQLLVLMVLGEERPFAGESGARRESWEIHSLSDRYHPIFRMVLMEEASNALLLEGFSLR